MRGWPWPSTSFSIIINFFVAFGNFKDDSITSLVFQFSFSLSFTEPTAHNYNPQTSVGRLLCAPWGRPVFLTAGVPAVHAVPPWAVWPRPALGPQHPQRAAGVAQLRVWMEGHQQAEPATRASWGRHPKTTSFPTLAKPGLHSLPVEQHYLKIKPIVPIVWISHAIKSRVAESWKLHLPGPVHPCPGNTLLQWVMGSAEGARMWGVEDPDLCLTFTVSWLCPLFSFCSVSSSAKGSS